MQVLSEVLPLALPRRMGALTPGSVLRMQWCMKGLFTYRLAGCDHP